MFDPTEASVLGVINYQAKHFLTSIEVSMRSFNATLYTVLRAVFYDVAKLIRLLSRLSLFLRMCLILRILINYEYNLEPVKTRLL